MENVKDQENEPNKLNQEEQPAASSEQEQPEENNAAPEDEAPEPAPEEAPVAEATENEPEEMAEPVAEAEEVAEEAQEPAVTAEAEEAPLPEEPAAEPVEAEAETETPAAEENRSESEPDADELEEEHHEEEHEEDHHEEDETDFAVMTREELTNFVKEAAEKPTGRNIGRKVQQAKSEFNRQTREIQDEALEQWKAEGNEESAFVMPEDKLADAFSHAFRNYKRNRQTHIEDLNKQKEDNLQHKKSVLEKLKELTEKDETGSSFEEFKRLQQELRSIGHVPISEAENLWNSYNFYVDRFYEHRSLYSEFKELDRKRNLTAKEEVAHRIEVLNEMEDLAEALKLLKQYQEEWRHIGPVPREQVEDTVQRYKNAVIKLYERKEKQSEELQQKREINFQAKIAILEKIEELANYDSQRVQDWIDKNKELGQWIENWRSIGSVPVNKMQELKERFTEAVRLFNKKKNEFFRLRKKEKVENLKKKVDLCERVEAILEGEDLPVHRKEVIKLQDEWKKVGPVPQKYSDKVWKRFLASCDAFFAKLSEQNNQRNNEQVTNLEMKNELIRRAEELAAQETIENPQKAVKQLQEEWNKIGFVPFKEKDKIRKKFYDALNKVFAKIKGASGATGDVDSMSYQMMLESWAQEPGGDRKLDQELQRNNREIKRLENEIATLENNMEFFSHSKTADKLRENIEKQVERLRSKMQELQDKVRMIRHVNV